MQRGVLAAAAGVVDGAKQLGFDVDGAVKSAADGATNGARAVADGIGKGFGAAAEGVGAAAGVYKKVNIFFNNWAHKNTPSFRKIAY